MRNLHTSTLIGTSGIPAKKEQSKKVTISQLRQTSKTIRQKFSELEKEFQVKQEKDGITSPAPKIKSSKTPRNLRSLSHFALSIPIEEVKTDLENLSIIIYYCTSLGKVKGQLTLIDDRLEF